MAWNLCWWLSRCHIGKKWPWCHPGTFCICFVKCKILFIIFSPDKLFTSRVLVLCLFGWEQYQPITWPWSPQGSNPDLHSHESAKQDQCSSVSGHLPWTDGLVGWISNKHWAEIRAYFFKFMMALLSLPLHGFLSEGWVSDPVLGSPMPMPITSVQVFLLRRPQQWPPEGLNFWTFFSQPV